MNDPIPHFSKSAVSVCYAHAAMAQERAHTPLPDGDEGPFSPPTPESIPHVVGKMLRHLAERYLSLLPSLPSLLPVARGHSPCTTEKVFRAVREELPCKGLPYYDEVGEEASNGCFTQMVEQGPYKDASYRIIRVGDWVQQELDEDPYYRNVQNKERAFSAFLYPEGVESVVVETAVPCPSSDSHPLPQPPAGDKWCLKEVEKCELSLEETQERCCSKGWYCPEGGVEKGVQTLSTT